MVMSDPPTPLPLCRGRLGCLQEKMLHEEERVSLYRDRERLNKDLNRLTNQMGGGGGSGSGSPQATATAVQVSATAIFHQIHSVCVCFLFL